MNSIFKRRSIRSFIDKDIEKDKIERILKAGMQSPSAHNLRPWEFLVITDNKKIEDISKMSPYAKCTYDAKCSIVIMCNLDKVKKEDIWWVQDLSACTQNILIQIVEEGLGGLWLGWYPEEDRVSKLKEYLSLPNNIIPFSIVALGYSDKENVFVDRYEPEKIYYNNYKS